MYNIYAQGGLIGFLLAGSGAIASYPAVAVAGVVLLGTCMSLRAKQYRDRYK